MPSLTRSTVIPAPIERVWDRARGGAAPGDDRTLSVAGGTLVSRVLAVSDRDHALTFAAVASPTPLPGHVATLSLRAITDRDHTLVQAAIRADAPEATLAVLAEAELASLSADRPAAPRHATVSVAFGNGASTSAGGIVVDRHGGPEVMRWGEVPAPPPGPGQVRIRHTAIGVNFIDVYCRTGYFDLMPIPGTPGMEAAGVVTDIGAGVAGFAPGDRVAYACPPTGAYAERRTIDAALLVPLPDDLTDQTAAAILLKGMTAEFLLHVVHPLRAGETVLVHAAAGGVGSILCAWAAALGATVIASVGSAAKARQVTRAGVAHVVLLSDPDWPAQVRAATGGRGVDVAFDAVGRPTLMGSFEALAIRGHLVSFGQAGGDLGPIEVARFAAKSARLSRPNYGHYMGAPADVRRASARLFDAVRAGTIGIATTSFALRDAQAAHRALEARATTGSLILLP